MSRILGSLRQSILRDSGSPMIIFLSYNATGEIKFGFYNGYISAAGETRAWV